MANFNIEDSDLNNSQKESITENKDKSDSDKQFQFELRKEIHRVKIWGIRIFGLICLTYVFIYFWNLFAPRWLCWLSTDDLTSMRDHAIAISTGVIAAVTNAVIFGKK